MALALEIWIGDLLLKFLADALVLLGPLQAAGAIAAGTLQTLPDGLHHFLVLVQSECCHGDHFLSGYIIFVFWRLSRIAPLPFCSEKCYTKQNSKLEVLYGLFTDHKKGDAGPGLDPV